MPLKQRMSMVAVIFVLSFFSLPHNAIKGSEPIEKNTMESSFLQQERELISDSRELSPLLTEGNKQLFLEEKRSAIFQSAQKQMSSGYKKDEMIITFKNGTSPKDIITYFQNHHATSYKQLSPLQYVVYYNRNMNILSGIQTLAIDTRVAYAEPNYRYTAKGDPTDPSFSQLWGLKNTGQSILGVTGKPNIDINVEKAWQKTKGSSSIVVAVIDTGVQITHPDLKNQIWTNPNPGENGYVNDVNGWDFYNHDNSVYDNATDDAHGTHVSGTIAAENNDIGVIGIAPKVKIMPLKFIGSDGGYTSDAILAINYAKAKGAKVANCSWGGGGYSQSLSDAIQNSGMLFIVAAGNDSSNNDTTPEYPASYHLDNMVTVAAINNQGKLSSFSNYGSKTVDIAAPGEAILSTVPDGYAYYSGTSMATPHVSGAAALLYSLNSTASPSAIKAMLLNSATKLSSLTNKVVCGGMVNIGNAVNGISGNDIPGTVLTGNTMSSTIYPSQDNVYQVKLNKKEALTLAVSGKGKFRITVFNNEATTVTSNVGIIKQGEISSSKQTLQFLAPYTGIYYIDIHSMDVSGTYTLYLTRGVTKGTYDDSAPYINYQGSWQIGNNKAASNGTYHLTNNDGATATIYFNGTGIIIKGARTTTAGYVKVKIDNQVKVVNLYKSTTSFNNVLFSITRLSPGRHIMVFSYTGKAFGIQKKQNTYINLDTFIVQ